MYRYERKLGMIIESTRRYFSRLFSLVSCSGVGRKIQEGRRRAYHALGFVHVGDVTRPWLRVLRVWGDSIDWMREWIGWL